MVCECLWFILVKQVMQYLSLLALGHFYLKKKKNDDLQEQTQCIETKKQAISIDQQQKPSLLNCVGFVWSLVTIIWLICNL